MEEGELFLLISGPRFKFKADLEGKIGTGCWGESEEGEGRGT